MMQKTQYVQNHYDTFETKEEKDRTINKKRK